MIELEKRGIPTVSITSHGFEADFVQSAKVFGLPGLPQVIIPYTLTSRNEEQAAADADVAFQDIVRALTSPPPERPMLTKKKLQPAEQEQFSGANLLEASRKFNREYLDRGWGDGFPLVPPTPQLVEAFLKAVKRSPMDIVGSKPLVPDNGIATVENLAINCAMAGCDPEHLPVLIASVEALTQGPAWTARFVTMSHGPHFFTLVVNGPIVKQLGIGSGVGMLGPGKPGRVNTVLGRAFRLILMNVGHAYPGVSDLDTIGTPLKYSMCVAENEEANLWGEPWHVERGFKKDQSVVTIFGGEAMTRFGGLTGDADKILYSWARKCSHASGSGAEAKLGIVSRNQGFGRASGMLTLLCPDFARILSDAGHTKKSIREYLVKNAPGVPLKDILAAPFTSWESLPVNVQERISRMDPETIIPNSLKPEEIHIVVTGGASTDGEIIHCVGVNVSKEIEV